MEQLSKGTRLKNRYEITKVLGKGGFGIVYQATDTLLNRFVAIKSSPHSLSLEINVLKELKDVPYISHMYDHFHEDGVHYIVMRLVKGTSLASYHRELNANLSPDEIRSFLPYICMTLYQMHKLGIIHRDISPGNLMITEDKSMYLIDFGTATSIRQDSLKNRLIFSHAGLDAPERTNLEMLGPGTDIYSLCATIVCLLIGEGIPSYTDRQNYDPLPSMLTRVPLGNKQQNALMKGLHVDVNRRYTDVSDFLRDFMGNDDIINNTDINYSVNYFARTDIGTRPVNQDNFMIDTYFTYAGEDCSIHGDFPSSSEHFHIVAIADGVAGSSYGDFAAKAAIQAASHFIDAHKYDDALPERLLEDLFNQINEKIITLSDKIGNTATTLSVLMWKANTYYVANVGDSPIYLLHNGKLSTVTTAHTVVNHKKKTGEPITSSDLHVLTRYIGKRNVAGSHMASFASGQLSDGDKFLLCSDGISDSIAPDMLAKYVKKTSDKSISKIWKTITKNKHMDNSTAILLEFSEQ